MRKNLDISSSPRSHKNQKKHQEYTHESDEHQSHKEINREEEKKELLDAAEEVWSFFNSFNNLMFYLSKLIY